MSTSTITFNALALRPGGSGVQTYVRELLRELSSQSPAGLRVHVQADAVAEVPRGTEVIPHPVAAGARRAVTGLRLTASDTDLFHGLDIDLPLRGDAPLVTTVHDLSVFDVPWAHDPRRAAAERLLVAAGIRRADQIVAVSHFTAERVAQRFGRTSVVVPLAPSPTFSPPTPEVCTDVRERYGLPDRCVLFVGTIEPRKRVGMLGEACVRAGLPLVLAGALSDGCSVPPGARHLGYVDLEDLPGLFAAARVVAYPSVYEGFGLPPIEAMACGAAVVATSVGGLPDVVADGAMLVPADALDRLVDVLHQAACDDDLNRHLRERGRAVAAGLTWADTAAGTLAAYRGLGVAC